MKFKLSIFLAAVVLFAACGPKKQDNKPLPALTVGVMSSMEYLPLAVAQQNGYFTKYGVTVNLQKFYSANERDAALQSGNLDGSIIDYTGAAIQKAGGQELYFTSQCDGTFELVAGKNLTIKTPQDLAGKNFAVARNTVVDFCTDMVLQNDGIAPDKVTKSEINKIPLRLEMLRNGKIDLTVLPDPFATIAKSDGNAVVTTMKDLGYHVTGIVFAKNAITDKAEAIKAFYQAYNDAVNDLKTQPIEKFHELLVKEIGFPQPFVANVKLPDYTPAQLPQEKDLEAVSTWLKERSLVPADFDIHTLVNSDFIAK